MAFASTFTLLSALIVFARAQKYQVVDECPQKINVFVDAKYDAGIIHTFWTNYSTGSGGDRLDGTSTKAIIKSTADGKGFYYLQKNEDAFNTGIKIEVVGNDGSGIEASKSSESCKKVVGSCKKVVCDDKNCEQAASALNDHVAFPENYDTLPTPPLYGCPDSDLTYKITFCPNGQFPNQKLVHPYSDPALCLDVLGGEFQNGYTASTYRCVKGSPNELWELENGQTRVTTNGRKFCLDTGAGDLEDNTRITVWECQDNNSHQVWEVKGDPSSGTIAIKHAASDYCLDFGTQKGTDKQALTLEKCDAELDSQKFKTEEIKK